MLSSFKKEIMTSLFLLFFRSLGSKNNKSYPSLPPFVDNWSIKLLKVISYLCVLHVKPRKRDIDYNILAVLTCVWPSLNSFSFFFFSSYLVCFDYSMFKYTLHSSLEFRKASSYGNLKRWYRNIISDFTIESLSHMN